MTTSRPDGSEEAGDTVPVYILAGGKSTRFGSDKARWQKDGVPMIVRVAGTLTKHASRLTVIAAASGTYEDLGLRTIGDVVPEKGPMGGLLAAIDDCREGGWIFLSACDWEGIRGEWVQLLVDGRKEGARAVIFDTVPHEPLFALYHVSVRGEVAARIEAGRLTMQRLLDDITVVTVPAPSGWSDVVNMNRSSDSG